MRVDFSARVDVDVAVDLVVFVALDGDVDVDPTVVVDDDGQGRSFVRIATARLRGSSPTV